MLYKNVISDIEGLTITQGRRRGEAFTVLDWQSQFVKGFCSHPISALSIARANGKTTFCAAIACSALCGALHIPRGEIFLIASSLSQARIAFRHVKFFMRPVTSQEPKRWRIIDNSQHAEMEDRETGTTLRCIGSDPDLAHGLAGSLYLLDEPAKWKGGGREMYVAVETSTGKQEDDRIIALGTRPKLLDHWFAEMLDTKKDNTYVQEYKAEKGDLEFEIETVLKANPSYHHNVDLQERIWEHVENARGGGMWRSSYRALRLNMGTAEVEDELPIVSVDDWDAISTPNPAPRQGQVCIGIDLGGGTSMSAIAVYWPVTGRLEVYGAFPASPNLRLRGLSDKVGERYLKMKARGELEVYPGKATNNVKFLTDVLEAVEAKKYGIIEIAADRYKPKDTEQALYACNIRKEVEWRVVGRGIDGSQDIDHFVKEVADAHLSIKPSLIMEHAILESRLHFDTNNNPALNKARQKGRNDPLQASVLAVGSGRRWRIPSGPEKKKMGVKDMVLTEMYKKRKAG